MKIVKSDVLDIKMDFYLNYYENNNWIIENCEKVGEHYRLLYYIGNLYNNIQIIDAGTSNGYSCIPLSQNVNNIILSYDIYDKSYLKINHNIILKTMDINVETNDIIKNSKIIFLDIDPHEGTQEIKFYEKLVNIGYDGILICDDINLNDNMKIFWNNIKEEKYDISDIGHYSGTGIVNFSNEKIEICR